MNVQNYKPNSDKYKAAVAKGDVSEKKVDKIISGTAKVAKQGALKKLTRSFMAEDSVNIKEYALMEIIIPGARRMLSDVLHNSIDLLVDGEVKKGRKGGKGKGRSYNSYYDDDDRDSKRGNSSRSSRRNECDDIILDKKSDAEDVLDEMDDLMERYGHVTIADVYELVGFKAEYTDFKWGWTDLRTAKVDPIRDGYLVKLPRAIALN